MLSCVIVLMVYFSLSCYSFYCIRGIIAKLDICGDCLLCVCQLIVVCFLYLTSWFMLFKHFLNFHFIFCWCFGWWCWNESTGNCYEEGDCLPPLLLADCCVWWLLIISILRPHSLSSPSLFFIICFRSEEKTRAANNGISAMHIAVHVSDGRTEEHVPERTRTLLCERG